MNNLKFLLLGTSLSCFPQLAYTQCVTVQDCTALGYTESSCDGGKGVKCPFGNGWFCAEDESTVCDKNGFKYSCTGTGYSGGSGQPCGGKYKTCNCATNYTWNGNSCVLSCSSSYQYTCSGTGYAGGTGSACGGKYTQCTCASGYEWKDGSCKHKETCTIGTLFYSDGTCSNDKLNDKELLGVVIYEKTASENGWVMTVKPITTRIAWDSGYSDYSTGVTDKSANASCTNTAKLVALGNRFKAANAANNYKAGEKQWCLPTSGLLGTMNVPAKLSKINSGILTAGGTVLGDVENGDEYIWTSSEVNGDYAWMLHAFTTGSGYPVITTSNKAAFNTLRPVFAF